MAPHPRPWLSPGKGIRRQTQTVGSRVMQTLFDFDPHTVTPEHSHPHEQLVYVLSGQITLTVSGTPHLLRPGDHFTLPPHVPHFAATGDQPARVLDTFSPLRDDFLKADLAAAEVTPPREPTANG